MSKQESLSSSFVQRVIAAKTITDVEVLEVELRALRPPLPHQDAIALSLAEKGLRLRSEGLRLGTFYAQIDQVFVRDDQGAAGLQNFTEDDYINSCRLKYFKTQAEREQETEEFLGRQRLGSGRGIKRDSPEPESRGAQRTMNTRLAEDVYEATYLAATSQNGGPAILAGQSRQSTHSQKRFVIWKKAAVGADPAGEIAHLVPAAVDAANSFWFVADFLFGCDERREWKETQCLLHGSNEREGKSKIKSTGIKHMVTNKVLLAGQRDYFDLAPCVIIVPILNAKKAREWTGEAYQAVMLIDSFGDADDGHRNSLESVCALTHFTFYDESIPKAESEDLHTAESLLQHYTKAILYAQLRKKPNPVKFNLGDATTAFFPKLSTKSLTVRKVSFEDNRTGDGHPAPDPLLLVSKAIAVLQKRHGFEIVAAAEPVENYVPSDLSLQAEEEFLKRREAARSYPDPVGLDIIITE